MKRPNHPPALSEVPTVSDGEAPDPEVRKRVVTNQVRAERDWNETAQDMVISNIVNESAERRTSRRELLILALLVLVILVAGSIYTYRSRLRDQFIAQQAEAAAKTPYRPETVR